MLMGAPESFEAPLQRQSAVQPRASSGQSPHSNRSCGGQVSGGYFRNVKCMYRLRRDDGVSRQDHCMNLLALLPKLAPDQTDCISISPAPGLCSDKRLLSFAPATGHQMAVQNPAALAGCPPSRCWDGQKRLRRVHNLPALSLVRGPGKPSRFATVDG